MALAERIFGGIGQAYVFTKNFLSWIPNVAYRFLAAMLGMLCFRSGELFHACS